MLLIVDHEEVVRRFCGAVLSLNGFTVALAADAREAVEICQQVTPKPDLAIIDALLPRVSLAHLREDLHRIHPGMQFLFMAGVPDSELKARGLGDVPEELLLHKPFAPAELLSRVQMFV